MYYVEMTWPNGDKRYLVKGWDRVIQDWTRWTMPGKNGYATLGAAKRGISAYFNSRYTYSSFSDITENSVCIKDSDNKTVAVLGYTETVEDGVKKKHKLYWEEGNTLTLEELNEKQKYELREFLYFCDRNKYKSPDDVSDEDLKEVYDGTTFVESDFAKEGDNDE